MDPSPESMPARRITPVRALVALMVVVALLAGSLAYHDGLLGVDPLSSVHEVGEYRVRGIVDSYDDANETLVIRDGEVSQVAHWNVTAVDVGSLYVIDLEVFPDGAVAALSFSKVLVFRS